MIADERFEHRGADIAERALKEVAHHADDQFAMQAGLSQHVLAPAQAHSGKAAFARKPAATIYPLSPIADARQNYPIEPALEKGRGSKPVDREREHKQISREHWRELCENIGS